MIKACFQEDNLNLDEGKLCVDFVNSVDWRGSDKPIEKLRTYDDLIEWAREVKLLDTTKADQLFRKAKAASERAQQALSMAKRLREALFDVFYAHSHGAEPGERALRALNSFISKAMGQLQIAYKKRSFELVAVDGDDLISAILWPIAISAAQLLASDELERVGVCLDKDGCGYVFFDKSRNATQKYCGSRCATRAKVRRYRERHRESAS